MVRVALDVVGDGGRAGTPLCVRATMRQRQTQPVEQRWNRQAMANNHVQDVAVFVR